MISGRIVRISVSGFRSLRNLSMPLDHLAVYLGENGTGKTNIYRALELCHHAASGDLSLWLAEQGGLFSAMWAGELRSHEKPRIVLSVDVGDYRYHLELGHKSSTMAAFEGEPLIKQERLEFLSAGRKYTVMERKGPSVVISGTNGKRNILKDRMLPTQTALSSIPAELASPELAAARATFLDWRFYHAFRVDAQAPVRKPCHAVTATRLDGDGANLAAVFATLEWIREDMTELRTIIQEAFKGAELAIPQPQGTASFAMIWPELPKRMFSQNELSDGTIQFLALCGALLSYHTPGLLVLNEPETSLHPDMMPALASLISKASERSQVVVVTHSRKLTHELENRTACPVREVYKEGGETKIKGLKKIGVFED